MSNPAALEKLKAAGFAWSLFHHGWAHLDKRLVIIRVSWYNNLPEAYVYCEFPLEGDVVVHDFPRFESAARYALQRAKEVPDVDEQSAKPNWGKEVPDAGEQSIESG